MVMKLNRVKKNINHIFCGRKRKILILVSLFCVSVVLGLRDPGPVMITPTLRLLLLLQLHDATIGRYIEYGKRLLVLVGNGY